MKNAKLFLELINKKFPVSDLPDFQGNHGIMILEDKFCLTLWVLIDDKTSYIPVYFENEDYEKSIIDLVNHIEKDVKKFIEDKGK